ncbi:MFS general substrate transporter [Fomitiporia mediterranea MF3/22]|uniref:MFS general substrate transporter n=1 Tax=Fomitiporia mediterranea (strain MF3/22) TaxID=694068 RepID=UPI0004409126|nr:MFS general substrate transporter [Fomitiporia mediterranea MF3/22]EJC98142.1 MFS general substrate transporter [Fomitiporia mediterranea MF3/22]
MQNISNGKLAPLLTAEPSSPTSTGTIDEEQPLSAGSSTATLADETLPLQRKVEKPFPWSVVISLYILTCMAPLAFELIFPFVNQMILENGITTDPERVGFYSGFIESIFALTSFISIMPCTYLADHLGRKPVILIGTLGLAISVGLFGMAKSYWLMILTRIIGGTLGGTNSTTKVMLTEAIEKSQQGLAFSGLVIAYRMGQIIGQPMGGLLAHPERNFTLFDTPFWRKYPFAFPCFIASTFAIVAVAYGYLVMEETLPSLRRKKRRSTYGSTTLPDTVGTITFEHTKRARPSVWSVLTPQVVGALISCSCFAFSSELIFALYPLFAFTPISSGGLGFSEAQIGAQLGFRSITNILVILFYAPLERRIGTTRTHQLTMTFWPISLAFYPLLNVLAHHGWEGTWGLQVVLGIFFTTWSFASLSWTSGAIVINNSVPFAEALSVLNGAGTMATTLPLAFAPAFVTTMFAFSIKHEAILHGNLIYVILLPIGLVGAVHSLTLKEVTHDWREDIKDHEGDEN